MLIGIKKGTAYVSITYSSGSLIDVTAQTLLKTFLIASKIGWNSADRSQSAC